jgi:hypothetical protein
MAIFYPLSLPDNVSARNVEMRSINAVAKSMSPFTFATQVHAYSGQMWQADITLKPMKRSAAERWIAWLISLKGFTGTFYLGDPRACTPLGPARNADTILVNGALSSGNAINIDSAPANVAAYLKAGDYLQIGTGISRQLFKVLIDVDTNGAGAATVDVWPNVRRAIADNAPVTVQNAKGLFRLSSNEQSWSANEASIYGITFGAQEAI